MSIQIPATNSISLLESPRAPDRAGLVDQLRNALGVGQVLTVSVSRHTDGESGILIDGNFFKAQLPDGLPTGQKLSVVVADSSEAVVLRILHGSSGSASSRLRPAYAYDQILRTVLPAEALAILKKAKQLTPVSIPHQAGSEAITKFLESLLTSPNISGLLLSQEKLGSPQLVQKTLQANSDPRLLRVAAHTLSAQPGRLPGETPQELQEEDSVRQHFERLFHLQELLSRLNPVLQKLGLPALLYIPLALNGLFSEWNLEALPLRSGSEDPSNQDSVTQPGYQRLKLLLTMPNLGRVHLELAHTPEEVLIALTVERKEVSDFLRELQPRLEKMLSQTSTYKVMVGIHDGTLPVPFPEWIDSLTRTKSVA